MKNKILFSSFFTIILSIFWFLFWDEYLKFQEKNTEILKLNNLVLEESKNFSTEKIENLEKTEVFFTPYEKLLFDFIEKIDSSKKEINFEVYMFTEKRILQSLKNAKKRWVKIKILLEKNPYLTENINKNHFEELKNSWIEVKWSNTKNYFLNHSKFFIIDDLAIISTWNLTYSTFTQNRDFFVFSYDKNIFKSLKNIFENDFNWLKLDSYHNNLVLSPNYSRIKIEKILESSKKNIKIYIQYLQDDRINNILKNLKKNKNIDIEIIIDKKNISSKQALDLAKNGIKIKSYNWKTMHSKVILIDEKYIFIWSENFSEFSLDKNREMWILLKDEKNIKKILDIFQKDFKNGF